MKIAVEGMTCGHCVRAITEALRGLDPGALVEVDLADNQVDFGGNADATAVRNAIGEAGYVVVSIDQAGAAAEASAPTATSPVSTVSPQAPAAVA